jgi:hypothetical protein
VHKINSYLKDVCLTDFFAGFTSKMDFESTVKPDLNFLWGAVNMTTELRKILNEGNLRPRLTTSDHKN